MTAVNQTYPQRMLKPKQPEKCAVRRCQQLSRQELKEDARGLQVAVWMCPEHWEYWARGGNEF